MIRAEIFQELFKVAIDEASDLSMEERTTLSEALAYDLLNGISVSSHLGPSCVR